MNSPQTPPPFIGIQLENKAFQNGDAGRVLDEILAHAPVNALMIFAGNRLRRGANHHGGTQFRQREVDLDADGRDIFDHLQPHAAARGVDVIFGTGEESWGYRDDFPGYTNIGMVDCYGRIHRQSCVNHPEWRAFQIANVEDIVRERPWLAGLMFMHERTGPLSALVFDAGYGDGRKPYCFCEHCRKLGAERGLDARRAREGYRELHRVIESAVAGDARPADGWFVVVWRLLSRYPEILGWDQLWWDSIHDYRAAIAGAAKAVRQRLTDAPPLRIGYHFQHAVSLFHFLWKASDDPARIIEYADWVKPSVYPGCSGLRAARGIRRLQQSLFADVPLPVAREFASWIMGRDPATEPDLVSGDGERESRFGPDWVRAEVARLVTTCAPRPVYAGLGIGIPGGTECETPDFIRDCTEAAFDGGAHGFLLSRGYLEMRPELLAAAGDVIRRRLAP